MAENVFAPVGNTTLLAATNASGRVTLPSLGNYGGGNYRVYNDGPDICFVAQGDATIVAVAPTAGNPANGMPLGVGTIEVFNLASGNSLAGICPTSTANLYITGGQGE